MIDKIFEDVKKELEQAIEKFPDDTNNFVALGEEVGELAKALLQITENPARDMGLQSEQRSEIYKEGIQVISMTVKILTRGDPSLNYKGRYCDYKGCEQKHIGGPCVLCYE